MLTCTFLGHRQCPQQLRPALRSAIVRLIETRHVQMFYVGNQGAFDAMVRSVLLELCAHYPHIRYAVVLAYLPRPGDEQAPDTMFPEALESVHPRYALSRRNEWMLLQSDFVISYLTHSWGGAAQYVRKAFCQGKSVIELNTEY